MTTIRSRDLLTRTTSRLLIVDMQTKLLSAIQSHQFVTKNCRRLLQGAGILSVRAFATEQYPKGLGTTAESLLEFLPERPDKVRFSAVEALGWSAAAEADDDRHQIVVAGIESHVCVLQTALDLLSLGYQVFVPADAIGSRSDLDWRYAIQRMSAAGVHICTTESVLFEWCEVAGTPEFKQISRLIKDEPEKPRSVGFLS